jgi:hypothetical protein
LGRGFYRVAAGSTSDSIDRPFIQQAAAAAPWAARRPCPRACRRVRARRSRRCGRSVSSLRFSGSAKLHLQCTYEAACAPN